MKKASAIVDKTSLKFDPRSLIQYGLSFMAVGCVVLIGLFAQTTAVLNPTDLLMFLLLVVMFVSLRWGRGPAIASSLASVLAFDYFFISPRFSFLTLNKHDAITLTGFLMLGLTISTLTERLRESLLKTQQVELLREKEKLYSTLLKSISHDLRTPLASITGTLSNLIYQNKALDEKNREQLIQTAYGESNRLNQLVENLLDMTKVESGSLNLSLKYCDVSDLIGVALQQFSKEKLEGHSIHIRVPKELPEIIMDYALMVKVLVNIIDNAFKYAGADTSLEIEAKAIGEDLYLSVIDHGPGIPEKAVTRVFDKFYRVETSQRIPGSGLGLAICKGIVDAHRGKIWAEHRPYQGAKIVILLPNAKDEDRYG